MAPLPERRGGHDIAPDQTALTTQQGGNALQGVDIGGKVYLQSKAMPGAVVCIACGMNVRVGHIDVHHTAHTAHRDHTLPQAMQAIQKQLEAGDY